MQRSPVWPRRWISQMQSTIRACWSFMLAVSKACKQIVNKRLIAGRYYNTTAIQYTHHTHSTVVVYMSRHSRMGNCVHVPRLHKELRRTPDESTHTRTRWGSVLAWSHVPDVLLVQTKWATTSDRTVIWCKYASNCLRRTHCGWHYISNGRKAGKACLGTRVSY